LTQFEYVCVNIAFITWKLTSWEVSYNTEQNNNQALTVLRFSEGIALIKDFTFKFAWFRPCRSVAM
jgi:hypothetical protein